jgi:serine/threonine protein kinase
MTNNSPASISGVWFHQKLSPGLRIDTARYILKRKLGHGACTEVWLARDVKWERDIALKFLPAKFLEHQLLLEQIDAEVRRSAQLAHPAIARIFHLICERDLIAVATEYIDGWPMAAIKLDRPQKRFRTDELGLWIHQICAALDYAHHGFCHVHRDLNPSNLLLNAREQVKLTDYGIDKAIRETAAAMGVPLGSTPYWSPQQILGHEPSVLDDIYSLGATLHDLLTGIPPSRGEARADVPELDMNDRLRAAGLDDLIPAAWEETISACLETNPEERPQSAGDVLKRVFKKTSADPSRRRAQLAQRFQSVFETWKKRAYFQKVWQWLTLLVQRTRDLLDRAIDSLRRSPRLLLIAFASLALFNLGLALWFLFGR